jgi:hypothetical protein
MSQLPAQQPLRVLAGWILRLLEARGAQYQSSVPHMHRMFQTPQLCRILRRPSPDLLLRTEAWIGRSGEAGQCRYLRRIGPAVKLRCP